MTIIFNEDAQPRLKVEVRRATQRDSYNIMRDRALLVSQYKDDDYMLVSLRQFPTCFHTSRLYREGEQADTWHEVELTHDVFLDLEQTFIATWLNTVFQENPLLAMQEVEYLKNFLKGDLILEASSGET